MFEIKNVNFNNKINYPDIKIPEGVTTFISGKSGFGKSVLLRLLSGVLSPTRGEIFYLGKLIEDYDSIELRREVLLVSQTVYLFDYAIKENFDTYYSYRNLSALSNEQIKYYLNICAVDMPLDSMCQILSGGERQRIFLAINLSFQSKVLMMDEPTSSLDSQNAHLVLQNIKEYCKNNNITLIIVSHDKALVDKYADNIILLGGGENERK